MIEETARVQSVHDGYIQVVSERQTACGKCSQQSGCSSSVLARLLSPRLIEMSLPTNLKLQAGDSVILGVTESAFLTGTLLVYGLPILALIVAAVVGQWIASLLGWPTELWSILFGLCGLFGTFYALMASPFGRRVTRFRPVVLRKV